MVRSTPGGNDDYGAVGFAVNGKYNEISYSVCDGCKAPSQDYDIDGGFAEIFNDGDATYIHHNRATNSNGFIEMGANGGSRSANNVRIAYNVIENAGIAVNVNRDNPFAIDVNNLRFENNTMVQTEPGVPAIIFPSATPSRLISRNNIYYLDGKGRGQKMSGWYGSGSFTHSHNIYYLAGGARLGFSLGANEVIADPRFRDLAGGDLRPSSAGPAAAAGLNGLGYSVDSTVSTPASGWRSARCSRDRTLLMRRRIIGSLSGPTV